MQMEYHGGKGEQPYVQSHVVLSDQEQSAAQAKTAESGQREVTHESRLTTHDSRVSGRLLYRDSGYSVNVIVHAR